MRKIVCLFMIFVGVSVSYSAEITETISYNFCEPTRSQGIISNVFGIANAQTVYELADSSVKDASTWINKKRNSNGNDNNIAGSGINISVLTPVGGIGTDPDNQNDNYFNGTPFREYLISGTAVNKECHLVIKNLTVDKYPNDATLIVYLGGGHANNASEVVLNGGLATQYNDNYAAGASSGGLVSDKYLYRTRYRASNSAHAHYWDQDLQSLRNAKEYNLTTAYADYAVFPNIVKRTGKLKATKRKRSQWKLYR
jgi:hypothetical protein